MNDKLRNKSVDYLFDAILSLKSKEECYDFFEDLCTVTNSSRFHSGLKLRRCSKKKGLIWRLPRKPEHRPQLSAASIVHLITVMMVTHLYLTESKRITDTHPSIFVRVIGSTFAPSLLI